ncbi:hypothetical protein OAX38_00685 [Flavobacteriaceae bacterium]|nr:hypothetical protein [Flavobacteriaceae bacterium]
MKKFQHKIVVLTQREVHLDIGKEPGSNWGEELPYDLPFANKLGDDGWELVNFHKESAYYYFFFKREKQ